MDDEDSVREVNGKFLKRLGYKVEFARNGFEAIELYKHAQEINDPFDVVILDLTIPGSMGGKETIKELLKINPDVKAIVSSGYSNDPIMANFKQYGFIGMITKPFIMKELSEIIVNVTKSKLSD